MNKSELITHVAQAADLTKAEAGRAVDAVFSGISFSLKNGATVTLPGHGSYTVRERAARTGRNPQTGAQIEIKASRNVVFKAGKALKENVQEAETA